MEITHERVYLPTETLGSWYDENHEVLCKILELPWKDNQRNISCFPEGRYRVTKEQPIPEDNLGTTDVDESGGRRPRNYWHFRIHDVPGRSGILVHRITFVKDLLGCQGVGSRFVDLNKDGILDVEGSRKKLEWLVYTLPNEFYLNVTKKP